MIMFRVGHPGYEPVLGRGEGPCVSLWSHDAVWATLPNKAQTQRWAGSLFDSLNLHVS